MSGSSTRFSAPGTGTYSSLTDPSLGTYFSNDRTRKFLIRQGLITKNGAVVPEPTFRERSARLSRDQLMQDRVARDVVFRALDEERLRQAAIRTKLEEIMLLENVRRRRMEREKKRSQSQSHVPVPEQHSRSDGEKSGVQKKRPVSGNVLSQRKKQQPNRLRARNQKAPRRKFITELELAEGKDKQEIVIEERDTSPNEDDEQDHHDKQREKSSSKSSPSVSRDRSQASSPHRSTHSSLRSTSLDDALKSQKTGSDRTLQRASDHSRTSSRSPSPSPSSSPSSSPSPSPSPSSSSRSRSRSPSSSAPRDADEQPKKSERKDKQEAKSVQKGSAKKNSQKPAKKKDSRKRNINEATRSEYARIFNEFLGERRIAFVPKPPDERREGRSRVHVRQQRGARPNSAPKQNQHRRDRSRSKSSERRRTSPATGNSPPTSRPLSVSRLPRSLERFRSLCTMTFRFNGLRKKDSEGGDKDKDDSVTNTDRHMIMVEQQHCGGNTIEVYRGEIYPNTEFQFLSQRHRGFPLGLSIYVDYTRDCRVSQCCESKHRIGTHFGNGHFTLVGLANPKPCYRCRAERNENRQKKKKTKSKKETADYDDESFDDEQDSPVQTAVQVESEDENKADNERSKDAAVKKRPKSAKAKARNEDDVLDDDQRSKQTTVQDVESGDYEHRYDEEDSFQSESDNDSANGSGKASSERQTSKRSSPELPAALAIDNALKQSAEQDQNLADNVSVSSRSTARSQLSAQLPHAGVIDKSNGEQLSRPSPLTTEATKLSPAAEPDEENSPATATLPQPDKAKTPSVAEDSDEDEDEESIASEEINSAIQLISASADLLIEDNHLMSTQNFDALLNAIESNQKAQSLTISGVSTLDDQKLGKVLQSLSKLAGSIKHLSISHCDRLTSKIGESVGNLLNDLPNLETIALSDINLGNAGVKNLTNAVAARFSDCESKSDNVYDTFRLRSLLFSNCNIGDQGVLAVGNLLELNTPIDTLNLTGCDASVSTETWKKFAASLADCTELITLDLSDCLLGNEKFRVVSEGLKKNESLKFLSLRTNLFESESSKYLLELVKSHSKLVKVDFIAGNAFDDGIEEEVETLLARKAFGDYNDDDD